MHGNAKMTTLACSFLAVTFVPALAAYADSIQIVNSSTVVVDDRPGAGPPEGKVLAPILPSVPEIKPTVSVVVNPSASVVVYVTPPVFDIPETAGTTATMDRPLPEISSTPIEDTETVSSSSVGLPSSMGVPLAPALPLGMPFVLVSAKRSVIVVSGVVSLGSKVTVNGHRIAPDTEGKWSVRVAKSATKRRVVVVVTSGSESTTSTLVV
jgi:hypothetical protein